MDRCPKCNAEARVTTLTLPATGDQPWKDEKLVRTRRWECSKFPGHKGATVVLVDQEEA